MEVSISISFIIIPLCLASRWLNRRYEPKWKYFIWLALAVRLMIPVNLPLINGISILPNLSEQTSVQTAQNHIETDIPIEITGNTEDYAESITESRYDIGNVENIDTVPAANTNMAEIAAMVWCIGFCAFTVYQLCVYFIFRHDIFINGKMSEKNIIKAQIVEISDEIKLRRKITVIVNSKSRSPMMLGVIRPVLVIPREDFTCSEFDMIARHELTHCKRCDIWFKVFLTVVNAVHWFNPFVYLMVHEANADIELCCDADVLQNADYTRRKEYVDSIMTSMEGVKASMPGLTCFSHGGISKMKERFENIYNIGKKRTGVVLFAIIAIMSVLLGMLVSCGREVQAKEQGLVSDSSELTDKSVNYSDVRIIDKSNYSEDITITDEGFYESSIKNVFISYDMSQALDDAIGSNSLLFVEIEIDCGNVEDQWFEYNGQTLRKIRNAQVLLEYNKEFELWLSEKYPDLDEERKQNNYKIDNWEKHDIQEQFYKYWAKHHTDEEEDKYVSAINELTRAKAAFIDWKNSKEYSNTLNTVKQNQVRIMKKNGIDVKVIDAKILGYLSYADIASFPAEDGLTYSISWATDFSNAWRK